MGRKATCTALALVVGAVDPAQETSRHSKEVRVASASHKIGPRLRQIRENLGLSRECVEERSKFCDPDPIQDGLAGITAEQLALWEEGKETPTNAQLRVLADVYMIPTTAIFLAIYGLDQLPDIRPLESIRETIKRISGLIIEIQEELDSLQSQISKIDLISRFYFNKGCSITPAHQKGGHVDDV